jgi:hypothetical protein
MKLAAILGTILIALGITALILQGVTYTTHKTLVDMGPIKATKQTQKTIPIPAAAGGLALAGGVVLIAVAARKRK